MNRNTPPPMSPLTAVATAAFGALIPGAALGLVVAWISGSGTSVGLWFLCSAPFWVIIFLMMRGMERAQRAKTAHAAEWEAGVAARKAAAAQAELAAAAQVVAAQVAADQAAAAQDAERARLEAVDQAADQALFDDLVRDAHKKLS